MAGAHKSTALKQVQYGGMCAYLIKEDDKDITEPIARLAIKRLVGEFKTKSFVFVPETLIYGDSRFAEELGFDTEVERILNESNQQTYVNETLFTRKDGGSWSDGDLDYFVNPNLSKEELLKLKETLEANPAKMLKINWTNVSKQKLSDDFIEVFKEKLDWEKISMKPHSEEFLKKFYRQIDWEEAIWYNKFSLQFIRYMLENQKNPTFNALLQSQQLPEDFIEEFIQKNPHNNKINFLLGNTMRYQNISPEFMIHLIEKYNFQPDKFNIYGFMRRHLDSVPMDFVEKYKDKTNWDQLSFCENLTPELIIKFKDYLNFESIKSKKFQNFTAEQFKQIADKLTKTKITFILNRNEGNLKKDSQEYLKELLKSKTENEKEINKECVDAGLTTNAVFGSGNTSTNSLMNDVQKTENSPGVSVADVNKIYTPALNGVIPPLYRRKRKK